MDKVKALGNLEEIDWNNEVRKLRNKAYDDEMEYRIEDEDRYMTVKEYLETVSSLPFVDIDIEKYHTKTGILNAMEESLRFVWLNGYWARDSF